jgi:hypothetical protein
LFKELNGPGIDVKKMIMKIAFFQDGDWVFPFETSKQQTTGSGILFTPIV